MQGLCYKLSGGCCSLFCFLLCSLLCMSCNYNLNGSSTGRSSTVPASEAPLTPQSEETVETKTVQRRSLAICLDCHNGEQEPNLSTAASIKENLNRIQFQVNNDFMPPASEGYAPLTACQKELLNRWTEMGAPDSSNIRVSSLITCIGE
jgi:hypothetical protein